MFTIRVHRLNHEGQINILAFDLSLPAHVPPQARMLRKGTGLWCAMHDQSVGGGLVADIFPVPSLTVRVTGAFCSGCNVTESMTLKTIGSEEYAPAGVYWLSPEYAMTRGTIVRFP